MFNRIINRVFPQRPPITECIADWAKEGMPQAVKPVRAEVQRVLKQPCTVGPVDPAFIENQHVHLPARMLIEIPEAVIRGKDGYVILPDGSYCLENTSEKWLRGNPAYFQRIQAKPVFLSGDYFSLMSMHCREHYHWLHDVLTSVYGLLPLLPPTTRFLVPEGTPPERIETLKAIGIDPREVTFYDPAKPVRLERLHFAPPAAPHRFDDPEAIQWLRKRLSDHFELQPEHLLRLYVARIGTATRRIANEEEVGSILSEYGFTMVQSEDLSLEDQARLFAQAEAIVGPHGAGLTNMLFSKSGCRVLDITAGEVDFRTYYWSLANACDHRYFHLKGRPSTLAYDPEEFTVDLDALIETLTAMELPRISRAKA